MNAKIFPLFIATVVLLITNFASFAFYWVDVNVNVSVGSYVYQSVSTIGLLSCISTACTVPEFCCASFNNGYLFTFPPWGLYILPIFPDHEALSESALSAIGSVLAPFQYAAYLALFLNIATICLCSFTLYMTICTIQCGSQAISFKTIAKPLWIALLFNSFVIAEYFIITVWFLNQGFYDLGFLIMAYGTSIACLCYLSAVGMLPGRPPGPPQTELTYILQQVEELGVSDDLICSDHAIAPSTARSTEGQARRYGDMQNAEKHIR